jgi:RNA polymerase sigma factor (sigma-70 family)
MDFAAIEDLVQLAKGDDKKAKEELMREFTPFILNLSKKTYVYSHEFTDVINHCYTALFKSIRLYNPEKHRFVAYATMAIKNAVRQLIRESVKHAPLEGSPALIMDSSLEKVLFLTSEDPCEIVLAKLNISQLKACLENLSAKEQELIKFLFFRGASLKNYSRVSGISYASAVKLKRTILWKLKKAMCRPWKKPCQ